MTRFQQIMAQPMNRSRLVNIRPFLVKHPQTTPLEQPSEAGFNDGAGLAQAAAVLGVALANQRPDASLPQRLANLGFRGVRAIGERRGRNG